MHIDTAAGSLQVLMLSRNRCRGADTGSRVTLVLSPRGSHRLRWVKPPGQGQPPQHLACHVSRSKRKVSSYLEWYPAQYWSKELFTVLIWALFFAQRSLFFSWICEAATFHLELLSGQRYLTCKRVSYWQLTRSSSILFFIILNIN